MNEMNDEISKIGAAAHQAAVASQNLAKLYKEAESNVAKMDDLNAQSHKLNAEVARLTSTKAALEKDIAEMKAERERFLAKFTAA